MYFLANIYICPLKLLVYMGKENLLGIVTEGSTVSDQSCQSHL